MQYLWVRYEPASPNSTGYPIDFTWEREWRYCTKRYAGLDVAPAYGHKNCVLIVENDSDVPTFQKWLVKLSEKNPRLLPMSQRIVSLQTAARKIGEGCEEYNRLDTWPEFQ